MLIDSRLALRSCLRIQYGEVGAVPHARLRVRERVEDDALAAAGLPDQHDCMPHLQHLHPLAAA